MCRTVGPISGGKYELPPVLDVEFPGGRKVTGLSVDECRSRVERAYNTIAAWAGTVPIIYTSARVWREDLNNAPAPLMYGSPLWLARYAFKKGPPVMDHSKVPAPPVPANWGDADNWWFHQYQGDASGKGTPGFIDGNVDLNRFNYLAMGARGDRVKWVQRKLHLKADGVFGKALDQSVRSFQQSKSLVSDGIVGPRTFAHLCWE
jgi:GH25 family lysozyme M1 (1,4-beta-N-acetylmuramidase)